MKIKTLYESPELEVIYLGNVDIVTASDSFNDVEEDKGDNEGEWMDSLPNY
jgi:hypothetical protein